MRRPQRTEAAQRLEARTARTFEAPLRAGVSSNKCPARNQRKTRAAGARARGVRVRTGVVHSPATPLAAALHAATGSRRRLPEGSDRTRRQNGV